MEKEKIVVMSFDLKHTLKRHRPSPSSTSKKKSIFIRTRGLRETREDGKYGMVCFRLTISTPSNGEVEEENERRSKIKPVATLEELKQIEGMGWEGAHVSIGSSIYCIGGKVDQHGTPKLSRRVRIVDIVSGSWSKGKNMLNARHNCEGICVNGKIYVFGGASRAPWAEVFDPQSNTWNALPDPPSPIYSVYVCPIDGANILVGSQCSPRLYTYNIVNEKWTTLSDKFTASPGRTDPIVVDSTMYWLDSDEVFAHSIDSMKRIEGKLNNEDMQNFMCNNSVMDLGYLPLLVHAHGDIYAFIWLEHKPLPGRKFLSMLRCVCLRISKQAHNLSVSTISTHTFPLGRRLDYLDGMVMDGSAAAGEIGKLVMPKEHAVD